MTTMTRLEVLDPTQAAIPQHAVLAPRPDTLDGKVLGLLSNSKRNATEMLQMVHDVLADRYEFARVVTMDKGNASKPCPKNIMQELAAQCDVVLTASGD